MRFKNITFKIYFFMKHFFQKLSEAIIIDVVKTILIALVSIIATYVFDGILVQKYPTEDYEIQLNVIYILIFIYLLLSVYSKIIIRYLPKKLDFEILEKEICHRLKK